MSNTLKSAWLFNALGWAMYFGGHLYSPLFFLSLLFQVGSAIQVIRHVGWEL